jgi:hypothetical protein
LEHERPWPCAIGELHAQIAAGLVELNGGSFDEASAHFERALELAKAIR